jgi:manganese-dependent inorganic pyrophosphatase
MTVGSTNTILYQMYREQRVQAPDWVLGLMLSGIISDTLMLQSPTTTRLDVETVGLINQVLKMNLEDFSHEMFMAASQQMSDNPAEMLSQDYKEFLCDLGRFGVSQVFTLDYEGVLKNQKALLAALKAKTQNRDLVMSILMVTDISKRGSYLFYAEGERKICERIFDSGDQGGFFEQVVSRKQQMIPRILESIHLIED